MSRVAEKKQSFIQATDIHCLQYAQCTRAPPPSCEKHNTNQSNDMHDARIHVAHIEQTSHRPMTTRVLVDVVDNTIKRHSFARVRSRTPDMGSPKTRRKHPSSLSSSVRWYASSVVPARAFHAFDRWMHAGPIIPQRYDASSSSASSRRAHASAYDDSRDRLRCLRTPGAIVKTLIAVLVVMWLISAPQASTTSKTPTGSVDAYHPRVATSERGVGDASVNAAPRTGAVRKPRQVTTTSATTSEKAGEKASDEAAKDINGDNHVDVASVTSVSKRIIHSVSSSVSKDIEAKAEEALEVLRELRDAVDEDVEVQSKSTAENTENAGVDPDFDGAATSDDGVEDVKPKTSSSVSSLSGVEDADDGHEARAPATTAPKMSDETARALREELENLRRVPHAKVNRIAHVTGALDDDVIDPSKIKVVSLNKPRAYVYESFLSDEEVKHVLDLANKSGLSKSGVVDSTTGGSTTSDIRTSTGTYIGKGHDDVIKRIENRIALWSQIPVSHGESLQVLHYDPGQEYKAHFDYFFHEAGKKNNRIATVLLYLSDVEEGGETVFPKTNLPLSRNQSMFSECGNSGRSIKANRGDALLFWSMTPGGELDSGSSHAGCPVIKGEKWTATKWMHVNPLGSRDEEVHKIFYEGGPEATVGCNDTNTRCHSWATSGECDKNPAYMRDSCSMSCRVCRGGWRDGSYVRPATRE